MPPQKRAGIAIGLAGLLLVPLIPAPPPLTELGLSRLGLLLFAVTWWITAPVPMAVTTVTALAGGVLIGAWTVTDAFSAPTSWVMWFAIGTFGLSAALESTGFNRRFALTFLAARLTRSRPRAFLVMFLLSAALMSTVMSSTVVAVVWLSLGTTMFAALGWQKGDRFAEMMAIGIAWAANVGGVGTPVGTAPNLVAIGLVAQGTGRTVSFLTWTAVGMLTVAVLMAVVFLTIRYGVGPDLGTRTRPDTAAFVDGELSSLGPVTTAEKWAVGWGLVAVLLWLAPDAATAFGSAETARLVNARLGLVVPALLVPVAMCLVPVGADRQPVLTWAAWARGVEWGMILFIGGVLVVGSAVAEPATGIPAALQAALEPLLGGLPEYAIVFALTLGVVLVTGVISNLVSMTIFVPLGLALFHGLGIGHPSALGLVLGMGASLDYLLPSGTTTNALVAASGWMRVSTMLRYGLVLALATAVVLTFLSYPLAKWLLG